MINEGFFLYNGFERDVPSIMKNNLCNVIVHKSASITVHM